MQNQRINLLFVIESLSGGGAEKVLVTLLRHLNYSKFAVTLCCIVNKGEHIKHIDPRVRYTYLLPNPEHLSKWQKWCYKIKYQLVYKYLPLRWVYEWCIPQGADVEIAFVEGFTTKLLAHSTNRKAQKLAWLHTDLEKNHWTKIVYRNVEDEEKAYLKYNKIVTVSDAAKDAFKREFPKINVPLHTLYNPIDSIEINRLSVQPIPVTLPVKKNIRFVSVGRLTVQKAYNRLLRIIYRLQNEGVLMELWLLGEGEERKELEELIKQYHLEETVTLWGFQSNPYMYMAQCDSFVCSSICEGYSTAVTEAIILGLPVITTDCAGMSELLKDGEYGLITENSEEALYKGIKKFLDNPDLLTYYKGKARERGMDFSLEALITPIERLLEK